MLLFKPVHVKMILEGKKTRTTRLWKKRRVKKGSVHTVKTELFGKPLAWIEITDVWRQEFNSLLLDPEHAEKEGGYTPEEWRKLFFEIGEKNRKVGKLTCYGTLPFNVWVVEFKLI